MADILVATESAAIMVDGVPNVIEAGRTLARSTHPIVTEYPTMWGPLKVDYDDVAEAEAEKVGAEKVEAAQKVAAKPAPPPSKR